MRDVDTAASSTSDRYIAGVAGGLGRHFDVDPTIIRVVLAVLTIFGGAGVLVYGAVWLFVPEDGEERAPVEVGTDVRRVILILAGIIALSIVFGTPFFGNGWGNGFPIPLLVIGIIALALLPRHPVPSAATAQPTSRPLRGAPSPTPAHAGVTPYATEGTTMTTTTNGTIDTSDTRVDPFDGPGQPPTWMPPPVPGPGASAPASATHRAGPVLAHARPDRDRPRSPGDLRPYPRTR